MITKVIKSKDAFSTEEAISIKGGIKESFSSEVSECTCDCWISNKNEEKTKSGDVK